MAEITQVTLVVFLLPKTKLVRFVVRSAFGTKMATFLPGAKWIAIGAKVTLGGNAIFPTRAESSVYESSVYHVRVDMLVLLRRTRKGRARAKTRGLVICSTGKMCHRVVHCRRA